MVRSKESPVSIKYLKEPSDGENEKTSSFFFFFFFCR